MVTTHRYAHDGAGTVQSPGRRLLAGLLVAATLALAAPTVVSARDDGETALLGGQTRQSGTSDLRGGQTDQKGAIAVGDMTACWPASAC